MFNILNNITKAVVKTALLPIAIVSDVGNIVDGKNLKNTAAMSKGIKNNLRNIAED